MNKLIEDQLRKCTYADLSNSNPQKSVFEIKKYTKPVFNVNRCYLVRISKELVNNPKSVLATNWNNGYSPKYETMKIFVSKIIAKKLKVDAIYVDPISLVDIPGETFSGYLDLDYLQQLSELKY